MTPIPLLRFRVLVYRHGPTLVRGLVLLSLVGAGIAGYLAVTPDRTVQTDQTNVQTVSGEVTHSAVVLDGRGIWANETTLANRSVYFSTVSPALTLSGTTTVPTGTSVLVEQRLVVVTTASRDGRTFYENETVLAASRETVLNGTASEQARIDIPAVRAQTAQLRDAFGRVSQVTVTLRYLVAYDTGHYQHRLVVSSPLRFADGSDAYWLEAPLTASERHAQPRTTVIESMNMTAIIWLATLALVSFAGAAAIRIYAQEDLEVDELLVELHARQMSEWISDGELPMGLGEEHVRLQSLQDVVNIGIDNEKRIVHDRRTDIYAVVDGRVVYYYSKDSAWHDLPRFSMGEMVDQTAAPGYALPYSDSDSVPDHTDDQCTNED